MSGLTSPPDLTKIYLVVLNPYGSPEQMIQPLKSNIAYMLLARDYDVNIVNTVEKAGKDGLLLQVDLIRAYRGGLSKRIEIKYKVINDTKIMMTAKDSVKSKFGYNKIIVALGKRLSKKVFALTECFKRRNSD